MADGDIHVVPLSDLLEHYIDADNCWCDPRVEVLGAVLLIVHNSFDGREEKERREKEPRG